MITVSNPALFSPIIWKRTKKSMCDFRVCLEESKLRIFECVMWRALSISLMSFNSFILNYSMTLYKWYYWFNGFLQARIVIVLVWTDLAPTDHDQKNHGVVTDSTGMWSRLRRVIFTPCSYSATTVTVVQYNDPFTTSIKL